MRNKILKVSNLEININNNSNLYLSPLYNTNGNHINISSLINNSTKYKSSQTAVNTFINGSSINPFENSVPFHSKTHSKQKKNLVKNNNTFSNNLPNVKRHKRHLTEIELNPQLINKDNNNGYHYHTQVDMYLSKLNQKKALIKNNNYNCNENKKFRKELIEFIERTAKKFTNKNSIYTCSGNNTHSHSYNNKSKREKMKISVQTFEDILHKLNKVIDFRDLKNKHLYDANVKHFLESEIISILNNINLDKYKKANQNDNTAKSILLTKLNNNDTPNINKLDNNTNNPNLITTFDIKSQYNDMYTKKHQGFCYNMYQSPSSYKDETYLYNETRNTKRNTKRVLSNISPDILNNTESLPEQQIEIKHSLTFDKSNIFSDVNNNEHHKANTTRLFNANKITNLSNVNSIGTILHGNSSENTLCAYTERNKLANKSVNNIVIMSPFSIKRHCKVNSDNITTANVSCEVGNESKNKKNKRKGTEITIGCVENGNLTNEENNNYYYTLEEANCLSGRNIMRKDNDNEGNSKVDSKNSNKVVKLGNKRLVIKTSLVKKENDNYINDTNNHQINIGKNKANKIVLFTRNNNNKVINNHTSRNRHLIQNTATSNQQQITINDITTNNSNSLNFDTSSINNKHIESDNSRSVNSKSVYKSNNHPKKTKKLSLNSKNKKITRNSHNTNNNSNTNKINSITTSSPDEKPIKQPIINSKADSSSSKSLTSHPLLPFQSSLQLTTPSLNQIFSSNNINPNPNITSSQLNDQKLPTSKEKNTNPFPISPPSTECTNNQLNVHLHKKEIEPQSNHKIKQTYPSYYNQQESNNSNLAKLITKAESSSNIQKRFIRKQMNPIHMKNTNSNDSNYFIDKEMIQQKNKMSMRIQNLKKTTDQFKLTEEIHQKRQKMFLNINNDVFYYLSLEDITDKERKLYLDFQGKIKKFQEDVINRFRSGFPGLEDEQEFKRDYFLLVEELDNINKLRQLERRLNMFVDNLNEYRTKTKRIRAIKESQAKSQDLKFTMKSSPLLTY